MAAAADGKKVLQLKLQLKESSESKTVLKTLKKLQELDITLEILAETGIGKTVNSFRKHGEAGEVAKALVSRWKKLVPKECTSFVQQQHALPKENSISEVKNLTGEEETSDANDKKNNFDKNSEGDNSDLECKESKSIEGKIKTNPNNKSKDNVDADEKCVTKKDSNRKPVIRPKSCQSLKLADDEPAKLKSEPDIKKTVSEITNNQGTKGASRVKKVSVQEDERIRKPSETKLVTCNTKYEKTKKTKGKMVAMTDVDQQSGDDSGTPSMSFEACLSYELAAPKRKKKKSRDGKKPSKKFKTNQNRNVLVPTHGVKSSKETTTKDPPKMTAKGSVMDLLNIPLPTTLPECEDLSNFNYYERKTEEKIDVFEEEGPVFTGQRLNKKMQVYSGTKMAYLPTMMTLYQQCIRALQNNIDLLYEIGGVPFDILEPVLERCTPEQLLRIEECNPVYIGVTDHLWEKHCQRDFRSAQLEEYESWREMHLRLSEERERKLKRLTKSIVSAHSRRPVGRQVKMAFIHSAAKPPRNVRIQQEIYGTAGSILQPHPLDKPSVKSLESRNRPSFSEPSRPAVTSAGSSQAQDPRKIKRVAPMMAKTLKAFKNQLGRR